MSKKKKLIPELRFPEFTKSEEWELKILGEVLKFQAGFPFDSAGFNEGQNGVRLIRNRDLKSDDKIIYYSKSFDEKFIVRNGDILVGMDGDFMPCVWSKGEALLNQRVGRILVNRKNNHRFFFYVLTIYLRIIEDLTAKTTVKHLSHSDVEKISALVPILKEQNKIASCFSSLDEVIEAHSQKLELLKDHKKGLMQNLFPQEGQKVPKYRFKEFEKDGEWITKKLGQIGEPLMCKRVFKEQTSENPTEGVPFYKIGTFGKEADSYIPIELFEEYKNKYSFPKVGDILISASGTIGRLVVYDGAPAFFQDSNIIWLGNDENNILNNFLLYCYSTMKWQTSDGGIISRLYNSDFKNMQVRFPKNKVEQQKIADCLSFLDELITAQAEKIEQLKQHKKGLMQGLFPKMID